MTPCWYSLSHSSCFPRFLLHIGSVSGSASVFELQEKRTLLFFFTIDIAPSSTDLNIEISSLFFIQSGCSGGSEHDAVLQTLGAGTGRTHTGDLALVLFNWQVWSNWVAAHTHTHTHMLLFSMLILYCFSVQSSSADSWRVGAGPAAPEAVPSGPDEQMAADPTVFCHTSGSGVCLSWT